MKAKFIGGPADGEVVDVVDPIPDLVDSKDLGSWMKLNDGWYIVRAIDFENKEVFYEPVAMDYFPDAYKVSEGIYGRTLSEDGPGDGMEGSKD